MMHHFGRLWWDWDYIWLKFGRVPSHLLLMVG